MKSESDFCCIKPEWRQAGIEKMISTLSFHFHENTLLRGAQVIPFFEQQLTGVLTNIFGICDGAVIAFRQLSFALKLNRNSKVEHLTSCRTIANTLLGVCCFHELNQTKLVDCMCLRDTSRYFGLENKVRFLSLHFSKPFDIVTLSKVFSLVEI